LSEPAAPGTPLRPLFEAFLVVALELGGALVKACRVLVSGRRALVGLARVAL
jgi:hypothetical protein